MSEQKLKEQLVKLKEALGEIEPTDTQTRDLLNKLIGHLETKVHTPHQAQKNQQLLDMFKEEVVHFENAHPAVSSTLEDIIGILSRMGI